MSLDLVRLPGISSAERVEGCPASEVFLDRVREGSAHADRGTEIHAFVANCLDRGMGREEALRLVSAKWQGTCAALDLEKIRSGIASNLRAEVAYALDFEAEVVRELGQYLGDEFPATRVTEARGALDLEGLRADGVPIVKDLKTGLAVADPAENWQLRFFATCLMFMSGAPKVEGQIVYLKENGGVWIERHEFTADELFEVPGALRRIRHGIQRARAAFEQHGRLEVRPGGYCRYCPAYMSCPAKTAMVQGLAGALGEVRDRFQAMTPEELGRAWKIYEEVRPLYERVEQGLKDIARARGIVLSDGREVRGIEVVKNYFSKDAALELLRKKGASEDEIAGCSRPAVEVHARVVKQRAERKPKGRKAAA